MIGTLLNVAGILLGGLVGSHPRWQPSAARQQFFKAALGVFTLIVGFKLLWSGCNGGVLQSLKQLGLVLVALTVGKIMGRVIGLQKLSNRLGGFARDRISALQPGRPGRWSEGMLVGAALFCAAPLAFVGSVLDGLQNFWHLLAIKAVMDALAVMAFVPMFGRGVMLAALPVAAWQGLLTLGGRALADSAWLPPFSPAFDAVNLACGFMAFSVALVVFEIKKIELADYLPGLVLAPVLVKWLLHPNP